jgi:hypothetical protein
VSNIVGLKERFNIVRNSFFLVAKMAFVFFIELL